MKDHLFSFETTWQVPHDLETVWNHIGMVRQYPTWWPGMKMVEVVKGSEFPVAVGNSFHFKIASPLYGLSYTTTVTDYVLGDTIVANAEGDLIGTGTWKFDASDTQTRATFLWEVRVTPPVLRIASLIPPARTVMHFFHDRLMNAGEQGLRELLLSSNGSSTS